MSGRTDHRLSHARHDLHPLGYAAVAVLALVVLAFVLTRTGLQVFTITVAIVIGVILAAVLLGVRVAKPRAATAEPQRGGSEHWNGSSPDRTGPDGWPRPTRYVDLTHAGEPQPRRSVLDPGAQPERGSRVDTLREPAAVAIAQFDGGSRAGRAPWLLPGRATQSGIAADAGRLGDVEVRAASLVGPGHRCQEPAVERQDAYSIARTRNGSYLVVAVADGLSSSAHSELGARVAVSASTRIVCQHLDAGVAPQSLDPQKLFQQVGGEIVGTGRSRNIDADALKTLLIVAVVPTESVAGGSRHVWTAQLGDVSLWLLDYTGWSRQTGAPKHGLDRNTVDATLPFHPNQVVCTVVEVPEGAGVAVVTDGFSDVLDDVADAREYYSRNWATPPHPAEFIRDLCADAKGQTDDRTAVVMWWRDGTRSGAGS